MLPVNELKHHRGVNFERGRKRERERERERVRERELRIN